MEHFGDLSLTIIVHCETSKHRLKKRVNFLLYYVVSKIVAQSNSGEKN